MMIKQTDHDLLIELRTEMRAVRDDIKDLKENTSKRVDILETEKMNKDEVYRLKTDADKLHLDFEDRIRVLEQEQDNFKGRYVIIATVAMIIISALVSWGVGRL
jgi:hypothetical protein